MKKIFYAILVLGGTTWLASCSNDSQEEATGNSRIMVNLSTDMSFHSTSSNSPVEKRAINASDYTDINNYTVTLKKTATGETVHAALYSNWELAYEVEPGTSYEVTATYGEEAAASYDKLLMYGTSGAFTVTPGTNKTLDFQCKPQAAKVNVKYADDFEKYFSECAVTISTPYTENPWTMKKEQVGQELYLKADAAGTAVTLTFELTDKEGNTSIPEQHVVTVKPQTNLIITFKPDVTEITGGKFGVNITVDTDVKEEDVNITLPNDIFKN